MGLLNVSPLKDDMPSIKSGINPAEYHASDMRYLLSSADDDEEAIELLEDFVGEDKVFDLLSIFGLDTGMNEMSSAGGAAGGGVGSVTGYAGPGRRNREDDDEPSIIRQENIDLSMVDEVIRLIMEKGIVQ